MSSERPKLRFMRTLSNDSANLFPTDGALAEEVRRVEKADPEEKQSANLAREFVKWCCGFGSDFRNSPDRTNLQFWAQKTRIKLKDAERDEVLAESRRLFGKKMEQLTRKTDATIPQLNTMSE